MTMMLFIYNTFIKENKNDYYKRISDKQRKVLHIYNIIKFRNVLFDYCNSLDLSELKYEIENNDFKYIDQLLQIKNKIDNYYKQINVEYLDSESSDNESDINSVADDEYSDNETVDNEDTCNETVDNEDTCNEMVDNDATGTDNDINTKITENNIEKDINRLLVL
jgi:hypothetical protein